MWIDTALISGGMLAGYFLWVCYRVVMSNRHFKQPDMREEAMDLELWRIMQTDGYRAMEWVLILFIFSIMGSIFSRVL